MYVCVCVGGGGGGDGGLRLGASWSFSLWGGGGRVGYISVEDHYLHKKWNFTG